MNFTKKEFLLTFILLALLNVILRLPTTPHEIGWDSFAIHASANTISTFGYAKWWLNLSGVFGFYPYSYASAVPFFLSGISQLTSIDMEWTIWVYCVLISMLSALTAYLMASSIRDDQLFSLIVAILYSISSGILYFTTWTVSTRGLFIVLLPLFIYLLLKSRNSKKNMILLLSLCILLAAIHHLFYFLAILFIAIILTFFIFKTKIILYLNRVNPNLESIIIIVCFIFMFLFPFVTKTFIESGSRYGWITSQVVEYSRFIGILVFIFIGSIFHLIFKKQKTFEEWFVLFSLIGFTPFFYLANYGKWFFLSLSFIMIGIGVLNAIYSLMNKKKSYAAIVLLIFLLSSLIYSGYFQYIHNQDDTNRYMDDETYRVSLWMKDTIQEPTFAGDKFLGIRTLSISEVPMLTGQGFNDISYGFVNPEVLDVSKAYSALSPNFYLYEPYVVNGPSSSWVLWSMRTTSYNSEGSYAQRHVESYNFSYFIEQIRGSSSFGRSLTSTESKLYDSGNIRVWSLT